MKIFHIPSWYPCKKSPNAGIFTKDFIEAYAELRPDSSIYVSLWGHESSQLRVRSIKGSIEAMIYKIKNNNHCIEPKTNLTEIITPKLWWSNQLPFGGARQLSSVIERSFKIADQHSGGIDIIHAHVSYPAGVIARHLRQKYDVPFIITEHTSLLRNTSFLHKNLLKKEIHQSCSDAEAIVTVSNFLKKELHKLNVYAEKVIPNIVNENRFKPLIVKKREKFIFLLMGSISFEKGIDNFIESIAILNNSNNNFEFWIAGNGPSERNFKQLAKKLKINHKIKWLGNVSRTDAPEIFQSCDVFVLPSRYETFGVVYAEALACGKPVIATKCGGPEEFINKDNGLLVEPDDPTDLARAMKLISKNILQYDQIKIREMFMRSFSRDQVVTQYEDFYKEIIGS